MIKMKKLVSVLCVIAILATSLFCAGIMNASAASDDGYMYTATCSQQGEMHFGWGINDFTNGEYTISFDYYFPSEFKNGSPRLIFRAVKMNNSNVVEDGDFNVTIINDDTAGMDKKAGYHSFTGEFTATKPHNNLGFRLLQYAADDFKIHFWNIKITRKGETKNLFNNNCNMIGNLEKVDADPEITGYDDYMVTLKNPKEKTDSRIFSGLISLKKDTEYKMSFDYYLSDDVNGVNCLFAAYGTKAAGGGEDVLAQNLGNDAFEHTKGYHSLSKVFTSSNDFIKLCFRLQNIGKEATVIIKNISIVETQTDKKVYNEMGWTPNSTAEFTFEKYDEKTYIQGAMPEIKGAKIKVNSSAAEEQKLRFDIDFSAVANFGAIKEYGFAVAPNESDMTVEKILDSDNKVEKTYKVSDGTPSEMSVVINRNSIDAYGKRVALVAFVTTDNGIYYTDISAKSVMGVMKSIFSSTENLAKEEITAEKITAAHEKIANDSKNNHNKTADQITGIFEKYTGYNGTKVTIKTDSTDYAAAKIFTAHTFYYAKKGTN